MTRTESYQRTLQGTLASTTKWIVGREFNPSKQCRYYGRLSLWFLVSRKRASGPEFIWSSLFRPIQYPCVFGYLHCYKPWLGCSIECGKIVTLGKSLHGYAPMKLQFFEGMWLFVFPFFRCWNSFFRFIFRMTKKSGRRENKRKKVKNFSGSNHPGNLDICDLKEGNVRQVFVWPYRKQDNSRVDIIKPTKILEHAIAETHVISRFTTKKPILFRLRPQRAIACLPCHVPIVPGRGEGSWAGITPFADWSRFEQTQRRRHWWRTEIGQRQLRFEGRRNVIAVSRS